MTGKQAISAGHEKTLEVAKAVLLDGGNTFDAGIAAAIAMFITEPCMASAGAGGLALCFTPNGGPVMLDFFTQTPGCKPEIPNRDFHPVDVDFGNEVEVFHVGLGSCAVPGTIAGLYAMHERFGSMPMSELLQPAMQLAKEGVALNTFQSMDLVLLEGIFRLDPNMRDVFFENDEPKKEGTLLHLPHFLDFLEFLKSEGRDGFYRGEVAKLVSSDSEEKGGYIRRKDFENYEAVWRNPMNLNWSGNQLILPNGPSLGGAIMALIFSYLKKFKGDWAATISHVQQHYQHPQEIAESLNRLIPELGFQLHGKTTSTKGTSHFNIADKWGNALSFTTSIGEGSGYFIPGTDMQLNNMMGESHLLPNGFHSWETDVRLNSMMTPTMVLNDRNEFCYSGGSGGAGRIPFMIAQVIHSLYNENTDLKKATEKERLMTHDGTLHFEKGASVNAAAFDTVKEWDYRSLFFGGVHSILKGNDGQLQACGDERRYGVSEVF